MCIEKKGTLLQELIQILPQYIEQYLETSSYYFDDVMEVLKEEFSKYHLDQEKTCFNQDTKEKFQLFNQKGIVSDQSFIRSLVIRNAPHYFKTDRGYYQSVQNILYLNFARFIGSDGTILCPMCKKKIDLGSTFCSHCGTPINLPKVDD